jgi:hypothetical protein
VSYYEQTTENRASDITLSGFTFTKGFVEMGGEGSLAQNSPRFLGTLRTDLTRERVTLPTGG